MRAGKLNQRVTVERPVETQGASGAMATTWVPVATVWGEVIPSTMRARERIAANQTLASVDTTIRLRWSPTLDGINATWRLRLGSIIYNIVSAVNVEMANRQIEAMCVTGSNDG